ncbi:MAG TPA: inorganic phosphate transporter [Candidatus Saccharimonadales bacterium]|nr:inorganic phosphate transporter [Candidatus Saccharimonadales bacterium]
MDITLITVVAVALFFDFTNGFHDTANAIATTVSTKALSPKLAVLGAAVFNFLGAFISLKVAGTVAKGIVNPDVITLHIVLAGLLGAIVWNIVTWRFGLPTSSSHALIGGVAGAAAAAVGLHAIKWQGLQDKVLVPSLVAPFLGLAGAGLIMFMIFKIIKKRSETKVHKVFKRLQLVSGSFVAFTHGTNDAQKTMGIIALALLAANPGGTFHVPLWVVVSSAAAMAIGTYVGGWRIIHTLGNRVAKLEPQQGFAAETSTAATLGLTAHFGFPVSTTHTISGSILGAGASAKPMTVNWRVVRHIVAAWFITIPCAAAVGAIMELMTRVSYGSEIAAAAGIIVVGTIFITRNWRWESMAQVRSRLALLIRVRRQHP